MAWATIAIAHRWAMTGETTTRFDEPVRVGQSYEATARLSRPPRDTDATLETSAEIVDDSGKVCARGRATFVVLGEATAAEAAGIDADALDPSFIRPR
jgi:acyl-coenzyme A thioesterase PaaI-like protein